MVNGEQIDLEWLLEHRTIQTYFQPIVSIRKQEIVGLEALSRGLSASNDIIMPQPLFAAAAAKERSVELDRLCREKALENFKMISAKGSDGFLFLNLDTSIIDKGVVGSGHLIKTVQQLGLNPSSIVIEIVESKIHNTEGLTNFINAYKQYGFLIALDDMGSASSNLDRILHVRPDIIKIDRGLIREINSDYYKQELFKALVLVAKKTGSLVVAEGVETHNEAVTSLELGADFLQGYYIAHPAPFTDDLNSIISGTLRQLVTSYRTSIVKKTQNEALKRNIYKRLLEELGQNLSDIHPGDFEYKLREIAKDHTCVQCYYILDINGMQTTETVKAYFDNKGKRHGMFRPDFKGSDQSFKDYYIFIHAGFEQYISEPYISLANGLPCLTGSLIFNDCNGHSYILCIDFTP